MRAHWARISPEILGWIRDKETLDDPNGELVRRSKLFAEFLTRHRVALEAEGMPPEMTANAFREAAAPFIAAHEKVLYLEEKLLLARAAQAEGEAQLAIKALEVLEQLEARSPESWDDLDFQQKQNDLAMLESLRAHRERFLGILPLETRQEWERRLG